MDEQPLNLRNKLTGSIERGSRWLSAAVRDDGSFEHCCFDLASYYKSLLMFAVAGLGDHGTRCLNFIKGNMVNQKNQLCHDCRKTELARLQRNLANYMDAWIAIGSWLLGDYRFSEMICRNLVKQQNSLTGGIKTGPAVYAMGERYDLATAASCGRAFLLTGNRGASLKTAEFMCEALERQSDLLTGLDLSFDRNWRCMRPDDISERTYYRYIFGRKGEKVWFPAFCSAVMSEMYKVFRRRDYLSAAESYFNYITLIPEFRDGTLANGQSAWAAGLLAEITRKGKYKKAFYMIVTNVLARQRPTGEFVKSGKIDSRDEYSTDSGDEENQEMPFSRRYERTAELTGYSANFVRIYNSLKIGVDFDEKTGVS